MSDDPHPADCPCCESAPITWGEPVPFDPAVHGGCADRPASVTSADGSLTLTQPPGGTLTREQMAGIADEVVRVMATPEAIAAVQEACRQFAEQGWCVLPEIPARVENGKVCR